MIEDFSQVAGDVHVACDVAVVGAGPAGVVVALELARSGLDVVLVESGGRSFDPHLQDLSEAAEWDHERHAPVSWAVRRQLGGTSVIWGGRCVPYDPVDFIPRPIAGNSSWPFSLESITPYYQRASEWMACGRPIFDVSGTDHLPAQIVPGLIDEDVTSSSLERWSLPTNFGSLYDPDLTRALNLRVMTGLTCDEVHCATDSQRAESISCLNAAGGSVRISANQFVLACGGLETTRLLLSSKGPSGEQLGNGNDLLGRFYMAHLEGVVANVVFNTPPRSTLYGYERDVDGVYIRRRFAFREQFQVDQGLPNIVSWMTNPELANAGHDNGALSFVYLALRSPLGPRFAPDAQRLSLTGTHVPGAPYGRTTISPVRAHVKNIGRHPLSTARFMAGFGSRRFLLRGRKAPGFFVYRPSNDYPLEFHGEHLPHRDSRVTLSEDSRDALGRRRLKIDLRFSSDDIDGVIRAHRFWDAHFRRTGVGYLRYHNDDLTSAVDERLGGGFHQIGTTRMASSPSQGVVDGDLAVHGVGNLSVLSSSTFVTSGQANSTFMIVVLAVRLADRLRRQVLPASI